MHPMVRHEAAEALGAMSPGASKDVLSDFSSDNNRVVAESCVVALDAMVSDFFLLQLYVKCVDHRHTTPKNADVLAVCVR